ncbi:hypothetical protein [Actinophytocola glycyrrhizae]|uniref:Uncharacterized protein n=1 Tax=Actinophytocola glycyrrhizae TaxID=2044873 RepID=A0ABV9SFV6_9PSEU
MVVGEYFPDAVGHFRAAVRLKAALADEWQALLDAGLVEARADVDDDGAGRLVAVAHWPEGAREILTGLYSDLVDELWACLDSLIAESVQMFSVRQRLRDPERPRFFPMSDSQEGFAELLEESCVDGLLRTQYRVVVDAQPFWGSHENPNVRSVRSALARLLEWRTALDDDAKVGAWVTPVEPQVSVDGPTEVQSVELAAPGEVVDEREVARFRLVGYESGVEVIGGAGSFVDLGFAEGFEPADVEDTFEHRTNLVLDAVARLVAMFANLAGEVPGARRLPTSPEHSATWTDASVVERFWSSAELRELAESDFGVGVVIDSEHTTLLVTTEQGVFGRIIPAATPLNRFSSRGTAAERAAQNAAATWGLPDFVMVPMVEAKGRGVREISDGLIVVGDQGLVVQVKSRDSEPQEPAKEVRWVTKKIAEAGRQVDGTVRRVASKATAMVNGRGRTIEIAGPELNWTGVVIIDHPEIPEDLPAPDMGTRTPTVALTRRDWEFLFHQLRSSRAVIDYLVRVAATGAHLGHEPERYYELAAADARAEPGPVDPTISLRGTRVSAPLLPAAPAGSDDDEAHGMVRIMCEDIANSEIDAAEESHRLQVLAAVDQLPVTQRTELGRLLLNNLDIARNVDDDREVRWQFRIYQFPSPAPQLGFGVCSRLDEATRAGFRAWLLLRHHERGTHGGDLDTLTSVGVLLTPRHDGYRDWDTTMYGITCDPELTEDELQQYRELWNRSPEADAVDGRASGVE